MVSAWPQLPRCVIFNFSSFSFLFSSFFSPRFETNTNAAKQWLFNFIVTKVTPAAINSIGWRTFIMFGCFCTAMGVFVLIFLKDTTGRSLEEMDILFGAITPEQRQKDVELAVAEEYKVDPHAQHVDRVEEGEVYKSRDAK
jgi:hypothetical protein